MFENRMMNHIETMHEADRVQKELQARLQAPVVVQWQVAVSEGFNKFLVELTGVSSVVVIEDVI